MTMWRPGMRCVCVDAKKTDKRGIEVLEMGKVYTVRSVGLYHHPMEGQRHCLWLCEVNRDCPTSSLRDIPFQSRRFRPLSETRLDQFRQHLAPKPKVEERV